MTSARVDPLRTEFEAIRAALGAARTPAERADIKRRLMAVFREADSRLQELGQLKDDIRALVEQWRQAVAPDPAEGPRLAIVRPAIRQDRLGASTFIEKGWHLISLGDHGGAIAALQRALELAPNDTQAQGLLGWAQMLGGQYDEAMGTFAKVLEQDPGNAMVRVNIGYICLKKRIFGEAIEHLSRALRLASDRKATLYAHYYLGLVYLEREMYDDAAGFLTQAVELGPNLIEARYQLGRACWFADRPQEAHAAWSAGAAAGTFSPWSARCRQVLELVKAGGEVPRSDSS